MDTQAYADSIIPGIQDMLARDAANGKLGDVDYVSIGDATLNGLLSTESITAEEHEALQDGDNVSLTFTVDGEPVELPLVYDPAEDGFVSRTATGDMVV